MDDATAKLREQQHSAEQAEIAAADRIAALERELADAARQTEEQTAAVSEANTRIDALTAERDEALESVVSLQEAAADGPTPERLAELEQTLDARTAEVVEATTQIETLTAELGGSRELVASLQAAEEALADRPTVDQVAALESQLEDLQDQLQRRATETADATGRIETLSAELNEAHQALATLQGEPQAEPMAASREELAEVERLRQELETRTAPVDYRPGRSQASHGIGTPPRAADRKRRTGGGKRTDHGTTAEDCGIGDGAG